MNQISSQENTAGTLYFADEETAAVYVNFLNGGKGEFPKADLRGS
jgi:hypothetical protein